MYANNTIDVFHSNATFTELEEHVHEANDNGFYSIVLNVSPKVIIDDIARYKADAMELSFAKAVLRLYVEYKVFDDDSTEPNLASLRLTQTTLYKFKAMLKIIVTGTVFALIRR